VRLFAFHHAGGSQALYRDWPGRLPAAWDVRLMDAPGHGKLFGEPHIDDLGALAEFFLAAIESELDVPYAFFGHSMGGMVACELTHRLLARGHTPPRWLGLSSCRAPGMRPQVLRHLLSDEELRRSVAGMGGTPDMVFEDPDLWEVFGPIIRADLRLVETPRPAYDVPLPVPVNVYGGREDTSIPREQLVAWEECCTDFRGLQLFDGGHFYFQADPGPLLELIARDVRQALGTASDAAR
jgi:surfactin synthase thioesterase subunit